MCGEFLYGSPPCPGTGSLILNIPPQRHTNSGFIAASAIAYFPIFVFTICSDLKEIPFLCDICSHSFKNVIFILSNNFRYFVAISSHWSKHNYASVFVNINLFHWLKSRLYFKMVNRGYKIGFRNLLPCSKSYYSNTANWEFAYMCLIIIHNYLFWSSILQVSRI